MSLHASWFWRILLIPLLTVSTPVWMSVFPIPPSFSVLLMLFGRTFLSAVWRLEMMNFCSPNWTESILDITSRDRSEITRSGSYLMLSVATAVKWR